MKARPAIVHILLVVAAALVTIPATASDAAPARATYPADLTWLALGDSYSSGEGLRYIDAEANDDRTCERATGRSTVNGGQGSRSWPVVAYDTVRGDMVSSDFQLLACTGATTNQISEQYRSAGFGPSARKADLVTLTAGGNNLGFGDTVARCIGLSVDNSTGAGAFILNPAIGCDTTEAELRRKVDLLVGTSGRGPDDGQTLRDFLIELMPAMNPGGHVIVAGYPHLVEEPDRWGAWEFNRCHRIRRADAMMLRSVTGYLNQQIALLVQELNTVTDQKDRPVDLTFHWVDVSLVYENGAERHGLCSGDPWINGFTWGVAGPHAGLLPLRVSRSYHPNQGGHDATGRVVAMLVAELEWSKLTRGRAAATPSLDSLRSAEVPALCVHPAGTLVDGELPLERPNDAPDPGYVTLRELAAVGDLDGDGRPEIAAVFGCSAGGVSWPDHVVVYRDDLRPIGEVDIADPFPDVPTWRGSVRTIEVVGGRARVAVSLEVTGSSTNSVVERSFTIAVEPGGGLDVQPDRPPTASGDRPTAAEASDALRRYFLAAGARRYGEAWAMLDAAYQRKYGGFEAFTGFWERIETVGIDGTREVAASSDGVTTLRADVWFALRAGNRSAEVVEVDVRRTGGELMITDYRYVGRR